MIANGTALVRRCLIRRVRAFPLLPLVDKNFLRDEPRALFRYKGLFHSGIVSRFRVAETGKLLGGSRGKLPPLRSVPRECKFHFFHRATST